MTSSVTLTLTGLSVKTLSNSSVLQESLGSAVASVLDVPTNNVYDLRILHDSMAPPMPKATVVGRGDSMVVDGSVSSMEEAMVRGLHFTLADHKVESCQRLQERRHAEYSMSVGTVATKFR